MTRTFRTVYNHDNPVSPHGGVSMTDQQYLNECDVNRILKNYKITGTLPRTARGDGISGDFSDIGDFQQCLDKINRAKDDFRSLPADLRARFGNDPVAYVDFCLNPANDDECVRLGLKVKPVPSERSEKDILESIEKNVTPARKGGESAA